MPKEFEVKGLSELMPKALFINVGTEGGSIFNRPHAVNAYQNNEGAHDEEEGEVAYRIDDDTADKCADDGCNNGLNCNNSAERSTVFGGSDIGKVGVEAGIVTERSEEGHKSICNNDHQAESYDVACKGATFCGKEIYNAEKYSEYTPEDITPNDKGFTFTEAIAPRTGKEGGEGGNDCRNGNHCGNNPRNCTDFTINEGVKPLVFDIPSELTCKACNPNNDPRFSTEAGFLFFGHSIILLALCFNFNT